MIDWLLFAEANPNQKEIIMECLNMFCIDSGQKNNLNKSSIVVSTGVEEDIISKISEISNILITSKMETYLGVPSIVGRTNPSDYNSIIKRINGRLEEWKPKLLTLVGRITLAKSVLSTSPIYHMQSTYLLATLCNNIDNRLRNFIWGSSQDRRKIHLANWETMMAVKGRGGLSIRRMRNLNLAFMAKLGWRLLLGSNPLWVQLLHAKYIRGNIELSKIKRNGRS